MDRRSFLKTLGLLPLSAAAMSHTSLNALYNGNLPHTDTMPVLFLGHGSPMNAIEENHFVQAFRQMGRKLPKPAAILCVSAHWETRGTKVTAMEMPRTIHDFGGFPKALYEVQYPAPGSPLLSAETQKLLLPVPVEADHQWGLDHGAWSVIKHLYPNADVPVIQLSLDRGLDSRAHYELGKQLRALRKRGVLIVGSGNLVHNLRLVDWQNLNKPNHAYDWAAEARQQMNSLLTDGNHQALIQYRQQGRAFDLAIPTPEHYLPLLYVLGLQEKSDALSLFNDEAVGGSLTMTSVLLS